VAFQIELAFWAEDVSALLLSVCIGGVEVHLFLYSSSMSADSLQCHFNREGIHQFDFDEALLGVFLSQPSVYHALKTQHSASSVLGHVCEVSASDMAFPPLQHAKSCPWPFWPYSTPGVCQTVPAVHDLLALS
jgi:hypothetical protein